MYCPSQSLNCPWSLRKFASLFTFRLYFTMKVMKSSNTFLTPVFAQCLQHILFMTPFFTRFQFMMQLQSISSSSKQGSCSTVTFCKGGSKSKDQDDEGGDLCKELVDDPEVSVLSERLFNSLISLLLCERLVEEEEVEAIFSKK